MSVAQRQEPFVEWARDLFEADVFRLLLSTLIIISVLPFQWVERYSMLFFGVFVIELALRVVVLRSELRQRSLNRIEIVILVLDVIATLSFLPLQSVIGDTRLLRLVRLTRMLMLLSYWRSVMREIWYIVIKRERRYQLIFVACLVVLLTFTAAILLAYFPPDKFDFNGDGKVGPGNESFWTMVWWSFRQLQDPGNLMSDPAPTLVFIFSLVLTISGVFMIAFFIGIGASIVEELVQLGRQRRIGAYGHSLVCNVGPHSSVLIEELVSYYAKSFRKPRLVAMGRSSERFDYLYRERLRGVEYREGLPLSEHDLAKVDADRATRVILLGDLSIGETADSAVVSQILSVREANPDCWIYGELQHSRNVPAARNAGGEQTVPILASRFVALFLADLMVSPGIKRIYEQLLTPAGSEIYTCAFGIGQLASVPPPSARLPDFGDLLLGARRTSTVTLLGYLAADQNTATGFTHVINPGPKSALPAVPEVDQLRGFFGIAKNFEQMKDFCLGLPDAAAQFEKRGAEVPSMTLRPTQRKVNQVLVCGYHDGLVDFCGQLLLFSPNVRIFVMVPDRMRAARLRAAFLAASGQLRWAGDQQIQFRQGSRDSDIEASIGDDEGGVVRVIAGDWSDERLLLQSPEWDYQLSETDAVLLTHTDGDDDPDARTSLALLELLRLCRRRTADDRCLRIICGVRNTEKAALFERRFGQIRCDRRCKQPDRCPRHTVTVVSPEQLRHSFLAQGVLVPGLSGIYEELLSKPGNEIYRLAVDELTDAEAVVTFDDLLADLYARRRLVLIGVELADDEGDCSMSTVVVNPSWRSSRYRFAAGRLRGLFAVGKLE